MLPILVNSRGRAGAAPTLDLLADLPWSVVVEPAEHDDYAHAYGTARLLPLPESGRGLPYARQFALDHARAAGWGWFWLLDDDVTGLFRVRDRRCRKAEPAGVLADAEARLAALDAEPGRLLAEAALEYQQFAWSARSPNAWGSYCDVVTLLHAGRTRGVRYRQQLPLKGDRDFTMQLVAAGLDVVRFRDLAFACPKNGSNPGGLQATYPRESEACQMMSQLWGPMATPVRKPDGRHDVKIDWKSLRKPAGPRR